MQDYWYYGLRLRTDLPLVGLPRWLELDGAPDIVLRRGHVPERLERSVWSNAHFAVDDAGAVLVQYPDAFRLMALPGGREVWIALLVPELSMVALEAYLLAQVAGVLLHQRGMLPLHASSVVIGGRAFLFAGLSGRGKSTLAAALVRGGHRLLSDDITVIHFTEAGQALAVPGSPHIRLQDDAIIATGADSGALVQGRIADHKKIWRRAAHESAPVGIGGVFRLDIGASDARPLITRLSGPSAVMPLREIVYRTALGRQLGRIVGLASACLRLAGAAPIYRLTRPARLDSLSATLAQVTQVIESPSFR